jgi:hypothetical protein
MWHSLNHIGTPYFTHWANGELVTYNGFVDGYNTKAYSGESCAGFEYFLYKFIILKHFSHVYRSGAWGDIPCDWKIPYVCEYGPAPKEICNVGMLFKYFLRFSNDAKINVGQFYISTEVVSNNVNTLNLNFYCTENISKHSTTRY